MFLLKDIFECVIKRCMISHCLKLVKENDRERAYQLYRKYINLYTYTHIYVFRWSRMSPMHIIHIKTVNDIQPWDADMLHGS